MLGLFEIKSQTPKRNNNNKGFLSIKFKIQRLEDVELLLEVFSFYLSYTFSGFASDHQPEYKIKEIPLNKEQTIYYDYESSNITIV